MRQTSKTDVCIFRKVNVLYALDAQCGERFHFANFINPVRQVIRLTVLTDRVTLTSAFYDITPAIFLNGQLVPVLAAAHALRSSYRFLPSHPARCY